jgi:hypothetical protein
MNAIEAIKQIVQKSFFIKQTPQNFTPRKSRVTATIANSNYFCKPKTNQQKVRKRGTTDTITARNQPKAREPTLQKRQVPKGTRTCYL